MHSWRVLILPYIECGSLYKQYNFNEPWDGPNNKKLSGDRPSTYACPSDEKAREKGGTCTSYVAVVGSNAVWNGQKAKSINDPNFRDKMSSSIMLVEVADTDINWMEPKDLDLDAIQANDHSPPHVKLSSNHMHSNGFFYCDTSSVVNVAMGDGSGRSIPAGNYEVSSLKDMLAIGGCREYDDLLPLICKEDLHINWPNCVALAVWFVSVGLLLHQSIRSRKTRQEVAVKDSQ
jgi:hypothetical protein